MFSYCSNSFPSCFPPSSSSSPSPFASAFLNHENAADNTQLLHDPLVLPFIPTNNNAQFPEIATNLAASDFAAIARQDASNNINAVHHHYGIPNFLAKKPAAKKDRHSKIHTSQGLRDRRVRLSIEIARKFFDLQDMLGFDKASSTLEWLFNKSKKAIKELASTKQISSAKSFSNSSSECEEVVSEINQEEKSLMAISEEKKLKKAQKEAVPIGDLQAKKESREKARARARERTNHSMKRKCPASALNPQILHQLRSPIIEASGRSPGNYKKLVQAQPSDGLTPRDHNFNVIEESIVIKRKLKPSSMPSSNQQNFTIPKEPTLNHNDQHSFPNLSPNWDTNGRSSFCAVASMNLSTELQFFGKPWEECNNQQRLH